MLTFFSLQSTNGMLFFAFADSFLIRTCLGILFASLLMLLSYTNTSPSLCYVLYTLSFLLSLQWFCYPLPLLLCHYCQQFICASLFFSLSWEVMGCGSACPRFSAALGVCLFCYQAAVYDGLGLHGSLCFASTVLWLCLCWRCRGASIKLSVYTSAVADLRKPNNIWSLLLSTFGVGEGNFKNSAVISMNSLFVLFTAVELKDFSVSKSG